MSAGSTLFWTALGLAGVALIAPALRVTPPEQPALVQPEQPSAAEATRSPSTAMAGNGFASQELVRSPDGHFYAEAQVNGARILVLVDTGASMVALTTADAQRAGIALGSERAVAMGAGGPVEMIPVTIDRVAVGSLSANGVQGAVAEGLSVSLLGQSFLSRVGTVEISGDRMVLR